MGYPPSSLLEIDSYSIKGPSIVPELPEVETMVRGIRATVEGRPLVGVFSCRCACKPLAMRPGLAAMRRRAKGQTIQSVRRLAKRVVLELSSGDSFVIEPRMTGLMLLSDPPDQEHLRLEWRLADGDQSQSLWFWDQRGLGTVRLYSAEEFKAELGPSKLGMDALEMTAATWLAVCERTSRSIKVVMLDQKCVAGIGNLYASEILHQAGLHPQTQACELAEADCRRLALVTSAILSEAIRYEGSTLGDGTYRNALNQAGQYQNAHRVYQKHGQTCPTCRQGTIERIVQAQRSTFYCQVCQPHSEENHLSE